MNYTNYLDRRHCKNENEKLEKAFGRRPWTNFNI